MVNAIHISKMVSMDVKILATAFIIFYVAYAESISLMDMEEIACADGCTCQRIGFLGLEVDCRNLGLTRLPQHLPNETTVLDLSFNDLRNIVMEELAYLVPQLTALFLDSNKLYYLDVSALEHLQYFSASNNHLHTFKCSRNLQMLNLNVNNLGICSQQPVDLTSCGKLLSVEMKGNFLTPEDVLTKLPNSVRYLNLASNSFTELGLSDLPRSIEKVDLSRNQISVVNGCEEQLFEGSVLSLNLALNLIASIKDETFDSCGVSFQNLDLSDNAIEQIGDNAFNFPQPEKEPVVINLSFNQLESFNVTSIENLLTKSTKETRIRLDLTSNPINCTKTMLWVPEMRQREHLSDRFVIKGQCHSPEHLSGKFFEDLTPSDFEDSFQPASKIPFWKILILVFVVPGVAATIALILAVRMHWKDYRRYRNYIEIQNTREQMTKKRRSRHIRASAQLSDFVNNSVH